MHREDKLYCLFMYRQRAFCHEKTILANTIEEMITEINKVNGSCTIRCCEENILRGLTELTDQTINRPYHWTDKYHGFCIFKHSPQDNLEEKIYNRYSKDPLYNDSI